MCLFHKRIDILGYNIYRFCSKAAGPNLHPEVRSVSRSLSSVISLLKLPGEVLDNVLISLPAFGLEVQQESEQNEQKVLSQVPVQMFFHSTCLAANWQKKTPLLVQSVHHLSHQVLPQTAGDLCLTAGLCCWCWWHPPHPQSSHHRMCGTASSAP